MFIETQIYRFYSEEIKMNINYMVSPNRSVTNLYRSWLITVGELPLLHRNPKFQ